MGKIRLFVKNNELSDIDWYGVKRVGAPADRGSEFKTSQHAYDENVLRGIVYSKSDTGIDLIIIGFNGGVYCWPDLSQMIKGKRLFMAVGSHDMVLEEIQLIFINEKLVEIVAMKSKPVVDLSDGAAIYDSVIEKNKKKLSLDKTKIDSFDKLRQELENEVKLLQEQGDPSEEYNSLINALLTLAKNVGIHDATEANVISNLETYFSEVAKTHSDASLKTKNTFTDWRVLLGLPSADMDSTTVQETAVATKTKISELEKTIEDSKAKTVATKEAINKITSEVNKAYKKTFGRDAPAFDVAIDELTMYLLPVSYDGKFGIDGPRAAFCMRALTKVENLRQQIVDMGQPPSSEFPRDLEHDVKILQKKYDEMVSACNARKKSLEDRLAVLTKKVEGKGKSLDA